MYIYLFFAQPPPYIYCGLPINVSSMGNFRRTETGETAAVEMWKSEIYCAFAKRKTRRYLPNEAEAAYRAHANKTSPSCLAQQSILQDEQVAESNSILRTQFGRWKSDEITIFRWGSSGLYSIKELTPLKYENHRIGRAQCQPRSEWNETKSAFAIELTWSHLK